VPDATAGLSRQRRWQIKMAEQGRCQTCGRKTKLLWACAKCRPKKYEALRKKKEESRK